MLPILIPLFVNSFRRAEELALAMESRCYHGGEGRTRLRILKFHWNDLIAFLIMAGLIAAVVILQNTFKIDSYLAAWVKALIGAAQ